MSTTVELVAEFEKGTPVPETLLTISPEGTATFLQDCRLVRVGDVYWLLPDSWEADNYIEIEGHDVQIFSPDYTIVMPTSRIIFGGPGSNLGNLVWQDGKITMKPYASEPPPFIE